MGFYGNKEASLIGKKDNVRKFRAGVTGLRVAMIMRNIELSYSEAAGIGHG